MPPVSPATFAYVERDLPAELTPWLGRCWGFWVTSRHTGVVPHHVPPDGCTSFAILSGPGGAEARLSGPWVDAFVVPVRYGVRYWGVRCHPHTGGLVTGERPETLRNRSTPLARGLGDRLALALAGVRDPDRAAARLAEVLAPHVRGLPEPDPLARAVVTGIRAAAGALSIERLAAQLGIAPRTLRRRFREATGLSPKEFARIERLRRTALTVLPRPRARWAALAAEMGYADQSHLSREFRVLTGLPPERFLATIRATTHDNLEGR